MKKKSVIIFKVNRYIPDPGCAGIEANGLTFLCTDLAVPVSSLICCIELKSMVYALPIVDKLTSSSPD